MSTAALYLVTPDGWDTTRLLAATAAGLAGGARWLQYRDKSGEPRRRRLQAEALRALATTYGARFIVNDDPELAAAVAADGVHLGSGDAAIAVARARLGPAAIIGSSCYGAIERARAAAAAGVDYLAFGAFFPSSTKPGATPADLSVLQAARDLGRPLCAIGGIGAGRCAALVQAGADLVAVVSAVFDAADPAAAAAQLVAEIQAGLATRRRASSHSPA